MNELQDCITKMICAGVEKIVISKPISKSDTFLKVTVEKKANENYQIARYTDKQVFHENVDVNNIVNMCYQIIKDHFLQVNGWTRDKEYFILISKSGQCTYRQRMKTSSGPVINIDHNRKKSYLLEEGLKIAPLIDMGIFTEDGKIINSMYDKYKQINRFLEILDDEIGERQFKKLNVIDFGCGKSYLTFIVYYYLTEIKKIDARIIGLDLKSDVIEKCNCAAKKYGYSGLSFELGDINGFKAPFSVDLVITLHACDTATDYALYNAINWNAKMIFSVPCCQHELNKQIQTQNFSILTRYGIVKERFAALATDAIRGNLLEVCGYKTQLLEFIDFAHTPKNILIRAIKRPMIYNVSRDNALEEIEHLIKEFSFTPKLYSLLGFDK